VRGAVAALRDSSSASAAQATIGDNIEFNEKLEAGANWHAKQGDPKDAASGATKQETHRTRGPQVLTANEETDVGTNWQANQGSDPSEQVGWAAKRSADHKSAAQVAAQRKSNHVAHRGGGRHSPQVSTVWCGTTAGTQGRTGQHVSAANLSLALGMAGDPQVSTELFGPTVGIQGKTGQRVSTADFFLAPGKAGDPKVLTELSGTTLGIQGETGQRGSAANFFLAPGKAGDPQVPPALFGPTVGIHGKTGQRGSAANFFLALGKAGDPQDVLPSGATVWTGPPALAMGTLYEKEAAIAQGAQGPVDGDSEGDSDAKDVLGNSVTAADQAAMRILADNRSVRGSTASRFAGATRRAKASPSWPGIGTHYAAWVHSVKRDPTNPEAAVNEDAPERAYLAVMNGNKHLSVLHHLHR
jgi:hypothetical protein